MSRRFRFETRTCKYLNTYWFHFLASPLILDRARCFKNIVGYLNGGGAHTKMHFKTCQNPKVMARLSWICTWSMEKTTSNHEFTEPLLVQHCYFEDILWLQKYSKHFVLWFLIKLIRNSWHIFFASRHLWNHKQHKDQIIGSQNLSIMNIPNWYLKFGISLFSSKTFVLRKIKTLPICT